jgi:CheY-like chemotaxis protein
MRDGVRRFTILLAEDEPANAHLVKMALKESHILADLQHVLDGREALAFLRREGARFATAPLPDLILLDLNMPRMDGRECLAAIKQDKVLHRIPVLMLTTSDAERDVVAAYDLGASGYITKPLDMGEFIAVLGKVCNYWISLVRLPEHAE